MSKVGRRTPLSSRAESRAPARDAAEGSAVSLNPVDSISPERTLNRIFGWPVNWRAFLILAALLTYAFSLAAQTEKAAATGNSSEQFFIISSVDSAKKQLLLKEPTEITEVLQVNDKTRYTDKNGKGIQFSDLRAGDTVFIRTGNTSAGKVAASIRKGPMTVAELRRRYLK